MSALNDYLAWSFHTKIWGEMTLLEQGILHEAAIVELATLKAKLAKLTPKRSAVTVTESEYKDYLSEQDRIKREAEEER